MIYLLICKSCINFIIELLVIFYIVPLYLILGISMDIRDPCWPEKASWHLLRQEKRSFYVISVKGLLRKYIFLLYVSHSLICSATTSTYFNILIPQNDYFSELRTFENWRFQHVKDASYSDSWRTAFVGLFHAVAHSGKRWTILIGWSRWMWQTVGDSLINCNLQ